MKSIILAGGKGSRLSPTTNEIPKCLLPVAGRPMIRTIIDKLKLVPDNEIHLVVNEKFETDFNNFIHDNFYDSPVNLIIEKIDLNDNKAGSLKTLQTAKEQIELNSDNILVVGSDNLFSLDLTKFNQAFLDNDSKTTIALFDIEDISMASSFGVVAIDKTNKIISFEEKPKQPKSTLISTAIYLFNQNDFNLINKYLENDNSADRMGDFIKWMLYDQQINLQGHKFTKYWYDIGCHNALARANEEMRKK